MPRKASFDTLLAVELYKVGYSYKDISIELGVSEASIKMCIKRYAPEIKKNPLNKYEVISLFKRGFNFKQIGEQLGSTDEAVRKVIVRYAPEELRKKRAAQKVDRRLFEPREEEINLPDMGGLTIEDRTQLLDERSWGINQNESMSDYSFFQWNRQSFISDKKNNRKYKFDVQRGGNIQKDLRNLSL